MTILTKLSKQSILLVSLILLNLFVIFPLFYWIYSIPPYEALDRYYKNDPWADKLKQMDEEDFYAYFPKKYQAYLYLYRAKKKNNGWNNLMDIRSAIQADPLNPESYALLNIYIKQIPIENNMAKYINNLYEIDSRIEGNIIELARLRYQTLSDELKLQKEFVDKLHPSLKKEIINIGIQIEKQ
jgi:hypothetical protein